MSVVLSEQLPLLASAPDGIQKLRGLILELAVRGKLVPQDQSDEPASELLRKIEQERARLEAEGSLKKSKGTVQEDVESPISSVAAGWSSAPMGEVVEIVRGITFPSSEKSRTPETGRIRCLRTANVQDKIEWDDILYIRSEFVSRADQMLRPNDIVMSMANSRELVGKVALVESQLDEPATFGGFLGVLRPYLILPRFVMAFLRAPTVRSSLIDSASQTTNIANISLAKLRPLPFPIPPLAEQHRIVAKVDELMALCDRLEAEQADSGSAHARLVETLLGTLTQSIDATDLAANWQRLAEHFNALFTTEASIDALKQTVLQLAVIGKLVPQDPNDEPASNLLNQIVQERARLAAEGICKKSKPMPPVEKDIQPLKLPDGWEWAWAADVTSQITDGTHHTPTYVDSGIPFLSVKDLSSGCMDFSNTRFITPEEHAELAKRCNPMKGDLLLTKIGTTGIAVLIDTDAVFSIFVSVALLKLPVKDIGHYLQLLVNSPFVRKQSDEGTEGVGNKNLVLRKISSFLLPIPPLAEQHRIVSKVDELMALCDQLKSDLANACQRQATLANTLIESALEAA